MELRPKFEDIKTYSEFEKYYWYREELQDICKQCGLEYNANKTELNK
ncbi:MAG: SAP domain-containing protein, partial [Anaeroplasmataceae bacterium]|nr:SAP domain-containing protein [Anaeroplasmataceae bacterium]